MMMERQIAVRGASRPVKRRLGIRALLEWAFDTECAGIAFDEMADAGALPSFGMEFVLMQRQMLGTEIDTSRGRSSPADDAEIVASVLRDVLPWPDALRVAELARARRVPDWMPDATPRLRPAGWHCNRHGWHARTTDAAALGEQGWRPIPRRNRKGVVVHDAVRYCPCAWSPSAAQIAAARRGYLDWWGHLLTIRAGLRAVDLSRHAVTDDMPPMQPWKKGE